MKSRHLARAIAVQTLYSLDFNGRIHEITVPYSEPFAGYTKAEQDALEIDVVLYATYLINGVLEHLPEVDEMISRFSSKRSIENINLVQNKSVAYGTFTR